jgi:N-acyl-D-aspartate/D-glutamate deacylase
MLDYVVRGGRLVDGTGAPSRRADVGIRDGRIAAIGRVTEHASRVIDADGLTVTPGFVDVHTHYDAQVSWDPYVTPSSQHGVTTVVGGNCGFTVAPIDDQSADYVLRMLSVVEGIPYSALETLDCSWRSFGSWLDLLEAQLVVNAGFFIGHSTLRRLVMGEAALAQDADRAGPAPGVAPSAIQIEKMQMALDESLTQGALGFSSSRAGHTDHYGLPVPSRASTNDELLSLCRVVAGHRGALVGFSPDELFSTQFSEPMCELLAQMALSARGPVIINGPDAGKLAAADYAARRGARVVGMTLPHPNPLRLNFISGIMYDSIPGWAELMHAPVEEKCQALADPGVRTKLRADAARVPHSMVSRWSDFVVFDVKSSKFGSLVGRKIGEIAAERNADPFDTLLDIALADDLESGLMPPSRDDYEPDIWQNRAGMLVDSRTVLAGSDAGAHLDMVQAFGCITNLVGPVVRDTGVITLEEAVHQATDVPARLFGLRGRGRLAEGWQADIAIFDADRLAPSPVTVAYDVPGGNWRLTSDAEGLHYVFVNGTLTLVDKAFTGDRPGTVIRSHRDTEAAAAISASGTGGPSLS